MSKRPVRAFDYVNHPYEPVRDALKKDAAGIFQKATKVAEERSGELVASLSVDVSGIQLSKDVQIKVIGVHEDGERFSRVTHVELQWQAADSPGLFPLMKADLKIYPLSTTETQIELAGEYQPPLGKLGGAIDAVVGHRLAEASVHRFVHAVVEHLRREVEG